MEGNFVVHRYFHRLNFFGKTYGMERSISMENGVAVVNAYGSIIGDNKDHVDIVQRRFVDICTSSNWKYLLFGLEFEKVI